MQALANNEGTREGVVNLLGDLLDTDLSSGRTTLDVLLKEEDVEVEVESDHPHSEAQDMFKTLTFKVRHSSIFRHYVILTRLLQSSRNSLTAYAAVRFRRQCHPPSKY